MAAPAFRADEHQPDRAGLSREVNVHILALEARLDDESFLARDPTRHLIGFLCECGCMAIVAATRAKYEKHGGAWLEAHKPGGRTAPA
jgi:hypothetical protein